VSDRKKKSAKSEVNPAVQVKAAPPKPSIVCSTLDQFTVTTVGSGGVIMELLPDPQDAVKTAKAMQAAAMITDFATGAADLGAHLRERDRAALRGGIASAADSIA
jgi:hypothetical protein